ncbi:MAG: type II toxin-antitoxin system YafQ family toxin [Prevotella sp.]|nr:type II toxin-antitoxin system YafQ family toxin [Prevotella sp.]
MYKLEYSGQFKRDLKKVAKQGLDISLLLDVLRQLESNGQVDVSHRPHILVGNLRGFWECHITPDWLLIYDIAESIRVVRVTRTGSHSALFGKKRR